MCTPKNVVWFEWTWACSLPTCNMHGKGQRLQLTYPTPSHCASSPYQQLVCIKNRLPDLEILVGLHRNYIINLSKSFRPNFITCMLAFSKLSKSIFVFHLSDILDIRPLRRWLLAPLGTAAGTSDESRRSPI